MQLQTFGTIAIPGKTVSNVLTLATSIRDFGGAQADAHLWVFVPDAFGGLSVQENERMAALNTTVVPCKVDEEILKFPFALKVQIASMAEQQLKGSTEFLTWLDSDTLVLNEPRELILSPGKVFGYRPVHHRLIGPVWDKPLDRFWKQLYSACDVSPEKSFPMYTHTGEKIHPYFNAGAFTVRPEKGLLSQWWLFFQKLYRAPSFTFFYEQDNLYAIFMHQAVLTGILLKMLNQEEFQELSPKINYPLHLHKEIPVELRPRTINELTTVRYENIFHDPDWQSTLPIDEPLLSWLKDQFASR